MAHNIFWLKKYYGRLIFLKKLYMLIQIPGNDVIITSFFRPTKEYINIFVFIALFIYSL